MHFFFRKKLPQHNFLLLSTGALCANMRHNVPPPNVHPGTQSMPQCRHKMRFKLLQHQQRSLHTSPSFSEKKYNFVRSNFLKRSESCIAILCNGIKIGTPLLAWNICLLSAEGENLNVEWVLICVSSKWFKFKFSSGCWYLNLNVEWVLIWVSAKWFKLKFGSGCWYAFPPNDLNLNLGEGADI